MFKDKHEDKKEVMNTNGVNSILEGTQIIGDVICTANFRINGYLKGNLHVHGKLVVGVDGTVEGTIQAKDVTVEGTVKGKINASDMLSIKSTGKVHGEMFTQLFSVEPGAHLEGTLKTHTEEPKITTEN
jgi:cytoskeletal protein CcmA (bactofilin family)